VDFARRDDRAAGVCWRAACSIVVSGSRWLFVAAGATATQGREDWKIPVMS